MRIHAECVMAISNCNSCLVRGPLARSRTLSIVLARWLSEISRHLWVHHGVLTATPAFQLITKRCLIFKYGATGTNNAFVRFEAPKWVHKPVCQVGLIVFPNKHLKNSYLFCTMLRTGNLILTRRNRKRQNRLLTRHKCLPNSFQPPHPSQNVIHELKLMS